MPYIQDIISAIYKTDIKSDRLNDEMKQRLGLATRSASAKIALALSISDENQVDEHHLRGKESGKDIRGVNLFDSDMWPAIVALMIKHSGRQLDKAEFQNVIGAHWARGLSMMDRLWQQSVEEDANNRESKYDIFIRKLSDRANYQEKEPLAERGATADAVADMGTTWPIEFHVGATDDGDIKWIVNAPGGSPHLAVMGEPNTGKTRFALRFAQDIKEKSDCHVFVFDMGKGDISDSSQFVRSIDAKTIRSPQEPIPLDMLYVTNREDKQEVQTVASRFCDSLSHVSQKGFGDVQKAALRTIVANLLAKKQKISFDMLLNETTKYYQENNKKEDAVTAALSTARDFNLFSPEMSPEEFFSCSYVFDMHKSEEGIQRFTVFIILSSYIRYLMSKPDSAVDSQENRKITSLLLIDEARKVLGYNHPALVDIVRMSRSKGGIAVLISQSPDDYKNQKDDFITDIGANVCFRTNSPNSMTKRILRTNISAAGLQRGECLSRLPGQSLTIRVKGWV